MQGIRPALKAAKQVEMMTPGGIHYINICFDPDDVDGTDHGEHELRRLMKFYNLMGELFAFSAPHRMLWIYQATSAPDATRALRAFRQELV